MVKSKQQTKRTSKPKKKRKRRSKQRKASWKYILPIAFLICIIGVGFYVSRIISEEKSTLIVSDKYFVRGVDISHHNTILNWGAVAEGHNTFAFLKATEGVNLKDRNYTLNYELAKGAGLHVGSYHFFNFKAPGEEQAQHFIATAQVNSGDIYPVIDVEHSKANSFSHDTDYVAAVVKELKSLETVLYNHYGVHPIIYTNRDCYKHYIKKSFPNSYIWMSDLNNEPSDDIKWLFWQYSHSGAISGVHGKVDLNCFRYDFQKLKHFFIP